MLGLIENENCFMWFVMTLLMTYHHTHIPAFHIIIHRMCWGHYKFDTETSESKLMHVQHISMPTSTTYAPQESIYI